MARYLIQAAAKVKDGWDQLAHGLESLVRELGGTVETMGITLTDLEMLTVANIPDGVATATLLLAGRERLGSVKVTPLLRPADLQQASRHPSCTGSGATRRGLHQLKVGLTAVSEVDSDPPWALPVLPQSGPSVQPAHGTPPAPAWEMPERPQLGVPELAGDEVPAGSVDLLVGTFTRFSDLSAFSRTLSDLPGVLAVVTRHFYRGMVTIRVRYESPIPLLTRLQGLTQFKPLVRELGPAQFEVLIGRSTPVAGTPGFTRVEEPVSLAFAG